MDANLYGQEFVNETNYLTAGENDGFALENVTLTQVAWGNYTGPVIEVQFGNGSVNVKRSVLPLENAIADALARNSQKEKPAAEETVRKQAATEWNTWMRLCFSPFVGDATYSAAIAAAKPATITAFYEAVRALLPADYKTKTGRVLLTYKSNGYLELPKFAWMLARDKNPGNTFFTLDPNQPLTVTKYFITQKPASAAAPDAPATPVVPKDDLPF